MAAERRNLAAAPNLRVTLLNEKYLALRKVFNTNPFELAAALHGAEQPHFLCIGFGRMGASIVLHILKSCVYDPAKPVMITIIDQDADAAGAAFRDANPWQMILRTSRLSRQRWRAKAKRPHSTQHSPKHRPQQLHSSRLAMTKPP
jgi:hypothetical protein